MKACRGSTGIALLIPNIDQLTEVNGQFHVPAVLHPWKNSGTHGMGRRKSLRFGLNSLGKEKHLLPLREFESRTVASRYTGCVTPAPEMHLVEYEYSESKKRRTASDNLVGKNT